MKMVDTRCRACGSEAEALQRDTGFIAPCTCGGERERIPTVPGHTRGAVHGDDIPGGMLIKHGICSPDGSPKRYDTHSSIKAAAEAAGYVNYVTHTPPPDSDKSVHTVNWAGAASVLTPEAEAERIRHWHAHETELSKETR